MPNILSLEENTRISLHVCSVLKKLNGANRTFLKETEKKIYIYRLYRMNLGGITVKNSKVASGL